MNESIHPDQTPDPSTDHLFKQINDIFADVHAESVDYDFMDAENDRKTIEAEGEVIKALADTMGGDFEALYNLFEKEKSDVFTIIKAIRAAAENKSVTKQHISQRLQQILLLVNDLAVAKNTELPDELKSTKREIQTEVSTSSHFSAEEKTRLVSIIDESLNGESLNLSDPDDMLVAFNEAQLKIALSEINRAISVKTRIIIDDEFARYGIAKEDPLYSELTILISAFINSDSTIEDILSIGSADRFKILGIKEENFKASIETIFEKLEQG
jgi:hypothetical protein